MVSLRRHTHLRLCAGRTSVAGLPWFPDNRNATQNSSHAKPKSSHARRSTDVNQPKGNMSATRPASAKNFTETVLALPVSKTARSESEHSCIQKLQLKTEGSSLTAEVSEGSQVESLQNQVNDPGVDQSLSSQVKEPDPRIVQLENKIDSLQSMVNKLKEENSTAKVEFDMQQEQADLDLLEFDMILLQTIEKLCQNVEFMQQVDSVMGEPNQIQLRVLSQKVEKLREDVTMAG